MPLNQTVSIMLDRVYNENLVNTNLRKRALKKLIKDACSKTVFRPSRLMVAVDGFLGPLLANIIMTELERKAIKQFIDDKSLVLWSLC